VGAIADDGDGGVDLAGVGVWAGGDRVEARGETGQHSDQVGRIVQDVGVVVEQIDKATVVGVLFEVRLLLWNKETKEGMALSSLFPDGGVGLDHLSSEAGDLEMVEESVVKGGGS
jgi:hypothetical protein